MARAPRPPGVIRLERHGEVEFFRMARGFAGRGLYWTGCYLVDGLLVDCGPPALAADFERALGERRIERLVITHHHEDHMGAAELLRRRRSLLAHVHPAGVETLRRSFPVEPYRRLVWGRPRPTSCAPLEAVVRGHRLSFEVVHTPGHSADHVCLYLPERGWLFTGDLFLAERLRFLRSDESLGELIDSLRRVTALPLETVFCAHRGPLRDGEAALRRKLAHLEDLRGRALALLDAGSSEAEAARRLGLREGWLTWLSLGHFSARNFVRAVARERSAAPR